MSFSLSGWLDSSVSCCRASTAEIEIFGRIFSSSRKYNQKLENWYKVPWSNFVRPTLEHASSTLAPYTERDNHKIEMIQRRAARFVTSCYRRTSSVTSMMHQLGWDTIERRRELARLYMMYRIVHKLVDIPAEPYLTPSITRTRGHDTRYRQHLPSTRTASSREKLCCGTSPSPPPAPTQSTVRQSTLKAFQGQLAALTF